MAALSSQRAGSLSVQRSAVLRRSLFSALSVSACGLRHSGVSQNQGTPNTGGFLPVLPESPSKTGPVGTRRRRAAPDWQA